MPTSRRLDAETLLAHSAWLASLARALVAVEDEVDVDVQRDARSRSARVPRETAVPTPLPLESPREALERAQLRRCAVESVLALDEPCRSAVILRFFEEQDVAAIAHLTSAVEVTVRTRLRFGVERVLELLERRVDEASLGTAREGVASRALLLARLREIAGGGGGGAYGSAAASRGRSNGSTSAVRR